MIHPLHPLRRAFHWVEDHNSRLARLCYLLAFPFWLVGFVIFGLCAIAIVLLGAILCDPCCYVWSGRRPFAEMLGL